MRAWRTCPELVDTENSPSSSRLWDLWEARRVFQRAEGNAERFPQACQIPQPGESRCGLHFEHGLCLDRRQSAK
jgi:hypothetical protein